MIDPLSDFDWDPLTDRYDEKCLKSSRFNKDSTALNYLELAPVSDRELYRLLISKVSFELENRNLMTLNTYKAIIY